MKKILFLFLLGFFTGCCSSPKKENVKITTTYLIREEGKEEGKILFQVTEEKRFYPNSININVYLNPKISDTKK